jgi:hypothetical protein
MNTTRVTMKTTVLQSINTRARALRRSGNDVLLIIGMGASNHVFSDSLLGSIWDSRALRVQYLFWAQGEFLTERVSQPCFCVLELMGGTCSENSREGVVAAA